MEKYCLYIASLFLLFACRNYTRHFENEAEVAADKFAEAYFNYDFDEALKHVTDDSRKWVLYAASNVKEKDIEILRSAENDASVSVDSSAVGNDAVVYITVCDALLPDTIGSTSGKYVGRLSYSLHLVQEKGAWKVRMEAPLQSGK